MDHLDAVASLPTKLVQVCYFNIKKKNNLMMHPLHLGVQKCNKDGIKILIIDLLHANISKHLFFIKMCILISVGVLNFCSLALAGFLRQNINLQSQFSPCPLLSPLPHASYSNK